MTYACVDGCTQNVVTLGCNTLGEGVYSDGMRYFEITTPTVRQVTRNHFGCQTLTGARLENQLTNLDYCFRSHWDERYFYNKVSLIQLPFMELEDEFGVLLRTAASIWKRVIMVPRR